MADNPVTEVVKSTGIPALFDAVRDFAQKLLGPAAEEAGQMFADPIRSYRLRNQVQALARSRTILTSAGIEPSAVPLRTLAPLLEGASLEEEPILQDMWAALIANAATPLSRVPPAFPEIMRQLSPTDARILNGFVIAGYPIPEHHRDYDPAGFVEGVDGSQVRMSITNLERLGLLEVERQDHSTVEALQHAVNELYRVQKSVSPLAPVRPQRSMGKATLTTLGFEFMRSSLPPFKIPLNTPDIYAIGLFDLGEWGALCKAMSARLTSEPALAQAFASASSDAWRVKELRLEKNEGQSD